LDEPVSEGGFAMVDMRDDGEIADFVELCHAGGYDLVLGFGQDGTYILQPPYAHGPERHIASRSLAAICPAPKGRIAQPAPRHSLGR
jgi:hypothetical protein